ncbi:hypothetical protein [Dietzia alimentaria]|uniref:hypothetical protein n=1 Tax=Dietzia alimentaria TaxID=665550 RepID=UPI00029B2AD1|nr:hypothetical protein [Dietzia alimentaria]
MASEALPVRFFDRPQLAAAEQARVRLNEELREWSVQRSALTDDELGQKPHRRVPRGWPDEVLARVEITARQACVIDDESAAAEASRLAWSASAKLLGAAISLGVPLAVVIAVVAGA